MTDKQPNDSEGEQMSDYMKPPYTVDLSDSIADDESDCWVIDNDRGSVAEMTCPADDAEATARFLARAGNAHGPLVEALRAALNESGCDGDLCNYRWHDKARAALALAEEG